MTELNEHKKISISQFLDFLDRNLEMSIESRRFISNILDYVKNQELDDRMSALMADTLIKENEGITLDMLKCIRFHKPTALDEYVSETGTYLIPVEWSVYSTITVQGDNLQDAVDRAKRVLDDLPLEDLNEYVDGSYRLSGDTVEDFLNAQEYSTIGETLVLKDDTVL